MSSFETPSSALQASAKKYPDRAALKIPTRSTEGVVFKDITYTQFQKDVELSARYWRSELSRIGAQDRAVVGVWLRGYSYSDAVHIWGLHWAGYTPQMISLRLSDPSVVYELLQTGKAVALVHEPEFASMLDNAPLPLFSGGDSIFNKNSEKLPTVNAWHPTKWDDVLFIYHTSGSTSGIPKLVPCTAKWVNRAIGLSKDWESRSNKTGERAVNLQLGSFCHMAASYVLWFTVREGSCLIIPSAFPHPISEVKYLLEEQGLTTVILFPPMLSAILRQARTDPSLLAALKKADCIGSGGLDPDPADVAWGRSQGFRMSNVLGSTELGLPMSSDARVNNDYLLPFPGNKYEFIPIGDSLESGEPLLELVVLPDSPDCPVPDLCAADGKFYTGDLFIEPVPGKYLCKGRSDNWIKMETALRCDTTSIESNVMDTCGSDLVSAVVVVGVGRPCPTIIVEPKDGSAASTSQESMENLRKDILMRIAPFHRRRYEHERVDDIRYIVVVPRGTLPRTITKGNVRRKEVEKMYTKTLDALYGRQTVAQG